MTALSLCGFEAGANDEPAGGTSGTVDVAYTVVKRTGSYSLRCNPTTTASGYAIMGGFSATTGLQGGFAATGTCYFRFYFRYATKPASNHEPIFQPLSDASTVKCTVAINSSGQLVVINNAGSTVATGTTVLAADTWYCIEWKGGNGASAAYELRIGGSTELSGTMDQAATNHTYYRLGKSNLNGNTVDFFYDDVLVNDSAFIGAGQISIMTVDSNGSTMQWTSGTGSTFAEVDEVPGSGADYVMNSTSANQKALFGFISAAAAGISGTINGVLCFLPRIRENTSVTSSVFGVLRTHATDYDFNSSGQNLAIASSWMGRIDTVNPNTSAAWTTSELDAIEMGAREVNASAQIRLVSAQIYVDYTPPSTAPTSSGGLVVGSGAGA